MKVAETDREFLVTEALALADELPPGEVREAFQEVAWTAEQGDIPDELVPRVGELAALALETGRARAVHGPAGVRALTAAWRESPQGRAVVAEVEELNGVLTALGGLPVEGVRVAATGPGSFAVTLTAGAYELRLAFDRDGATLRSLNVGGGGTGE